ncbi:diguanylate cyclase domain-containing protein [Actinoplanes sp. CA-015351]|uniref:diguanylate cyclase domain-containing protein n=1 Tax=Actinoplanes sp. CA-015351 TaxID=3239897 RepID=UPI003D9625FC
MPGWSSLQLTEFFSAITRAGDIAAATRIAVQRAAEATDAELAAVVCGDAVPASVGLGRSPDVALFTGLPAGDDIADFPGLGPMHLTVHPLDRDTGDRILVARAGDAFDPEERQMLQGMARVLGLALRGLRTLETERELRREREREAASRLELLEALERRERLLETLLRVQRMVNPRTPVDETLDAITDGARSLLAGATTALVLRDGAALTVASMSRGTDVRNEVLIAAADQALAGKGPVTGGPVLAAPVKIGEEYAGAFVIAGDGAEILEAFAEQASLALTGAHTQAAVHEAHHDPLTRLPNRKLFLTRVEQVVNTGPAALLYLDLDLFKQVNDTLGHSVGDELLRGVADRIRGAIRDSDMAARFGGDEFAVLLEPITGTEQAVEIAQRVIDSISQPFAISGRMVRTRASVGIAYSDGVRTAEELLEDADLAMYRAKRSRPGTCRAYDPRMRTDDLLRAS